MKNAEYNFMMKSAVQHVMAAQFYSSRTLLLDSLDGIFDMIQVYSLVRSVLSFAALRHCVLPEIGSLYRWYTVCRVSAGCCQQQWYVTVIHTEHFSDFIASQGPSSISQSFCYNLAFQVDFFQFIFQVH